MTRQDKIRELLAQYPAGLTTPQMENLLNMKPSTLSDVPKWTAGIYCIGYCHSRNIRGLAGKPPAIWKLHTGDGPIPKDAEKPPRIHKPRIKKPS